MLCSGAIRNISITTNCTSKKSNIVSSDESLIFSKKVPNVKKSITKFKVSLKILLLSCSQNYQQKFKDLSPGLTIPALISLHLQLILHTIRREFPVTTTMMSKLKDKGQYKDLRNHITSHYSRLIPKEAKKRSKEYRLIS